MRVLIDGVEHEAGTASIPVSDVGFIRGYGVFEVIRSFDGTCFRLQEHLDRLDRSAAMLGLGLAGRAELTAWVNSEALVRIMVTGHDDPWDEQVRIVVTGEDAPPQADSITLLPVDAPWHADGADWELRGAKSLSYANNFGAIRVAKNAGYTDALLIGRSGSILEGPTFTVGWVIDEGADRIVYETPAMSLGILDSITRSAVLDAASNAGLVIREVVAPLERLDDAAEFFSLSTLRDVVPVTAVGDRAFPAGPHTAKLTGALRTLMASEIRASS